MPPSVPVRIFTVARRLITRCPVSRTYTSTEFPPRSICPLNFANGDGGRTSPFTPADGTALLLAVIPTGSFAHRIDAAFSAIALLLSGVSFCALILPPLLWMSDMLTLVLARKHDLANPHAC